MYKRTDLAVELEIDENIKGITKREEKYDDITVTGIEITSAEGEEALGKPKGKYLTVEFPDILKISDFTPLEKSIKKALNTLIPKLPERVLVVGLGNTEITPDSIGPFTAQNILATRHIAGELAENLGLKGLKSISVITPNVLGKTGIESVELVSSVTQKVKPQLIIVIDALAAGNSDRLFRTIQLCNTGIAPGSGVNNSRKELNYNTLKAPVIAIGIPTVVDADTLCQDITGQDIKGHSGLLVTSKDGDVLCRKICEILSRTLNTFLQPNIEPEVIFSLV